MTTQANLDALRADTLKTLGRADRALAAADLTITDVHTVAEMTADWFNDILTTTTPGARILEVTPVDKHDGMTDRMTVSLRWNDTGAAAGLPTAAFIKATPTRADHRKTMAVMHMGEIESHFYTSVQPEISDIAPCAFYARSHQGGRFAIVLEDLKALGLMPYWMADDCSIPHALAVAAAQAQFHARYWQSARFNSDLVWVRPRLDRYGHGWVENSHRITRGHFLSDPDHAVPEEHHELLATWNKHSDNVFRYWDTRPATLLHGDSHLGNTFSYPDGRAGYFDWQLIYRGPGFRDLAYFLMSALTNEQRIESEVRIVEHYLDELEKNGISVDREAGWHDYRLSLLDAWDASLITLHHGTYGHATTAVERQLTTVHGALADHNIAAVLDDLVR